MNPPHVHVFGDGEAKIDLIGAQESPELTWTVGMKRSDVRRALNFVSDNRDMLLASSREPRAASARYDRRLGRIVVELTNGCTFAFPPGLAQELETATEEQLAKVEVLGSGYGLHWEALDADFTVPGLLTGVFGTAAYMARRAGQATSAAKASAARSNGAKGGRPRKAGNR